MNALRTQGARMAWAARAVVMFATVIVYGLLSLGVPMLLVGCANTAAPQAPRGIVQTDAGRFVACTDCENVTPKHLGRTPVPVIPRAAALRPAPAPAQQPSRAQGLPAASGQVTSPPLPPPPAVASLNTRVTFNFGQAVLKREAKVELDSLVDKVVLKSVVNYLSTEPHLPSKWQIRVTGYTDDVGRQTPNDRLAAARARAVVSYLNHRLGDLAKRVEVVQTDSPGLCCYAEVGTTPQARSRNRRVELVATATQMTQVAPATAKAGLPNTGASAPAGSIEVHDEQR